MVYIGGVFRSTNRELMWQLPIRPSGNILFSGSPMVDPATRQQTKNGKWKTRLLHHGSIGAAPPRNAPPHDSGRAAMQMVEKTRPYTAFNALILPNYFKFWICTRFILPPAVSSEFACFSLPPAVSESVSLFFLSAAGALLVFLSSWQAVSDCSYHSSERQVISGQNPYLYCTMPLQCCWEDFSRIGWLD